ncbi:unnamed protein product, partial [Chrysoparadoxa australica]
MERQGRGGRSVLSGAGRNATGLGQGGQQVVSQSPGRDGQGREDALSAMLSSPAHNRGSASPVNGQGRSNRDSAGGGSGVNEIARAG